LPTNRDGIYENNPVMLKMENQKREAKIKEENKPLPEMRP
jgi:hypothetical protein